MQRCAVFCAIAVLAAGAMDRLWPTRPAKSRSPPPSTSSGPRASSPWPPSSRRPPGTVQIKVEYQPPDRMRQTITAPGQEPLETVLYGQRAYSRQGSQVGRADAGGGADDHRAGARGRRRPAQRGRQFRLPRHRRPSTARSISPIAASRSRPTPAPPPARRMLHRTIYVDPKTGLPALNIVAGEQARCRGGLQGGLRLSGEARDRGSSGRAAGENEIGAAAGPRALRVSRTSMMEKQTMRRLLTALALMIAGRPGRSCRLQGRGRLGARAPAQDQRLPHADEDALRAGPRRHDGRLRAAQPHAPGRRVDDRAQAGRDDRRRPRRLEPPRRRGLAPAASADRRRARRPDAGDAGR